MCSDTRCNEVVDLGVTGVFKALFSLPLCFVAFTVVSHVELLYFPLLFSDRMFSFGF